MGQTGRAGRDEARLRGVGQVERGREREREREKIRGAGIAE